MKTAIVTGANGFIGKAMAKKLLQNGYKVYAVVTNRDAMSDIKDNNLVVIQAFFDEYSLLHKQIPDPIDFVFHFAWAGLNGEVLNDYQMQLDDVKYSMVLLNEAKQLKTKKLIFASTMNTLETLRFVKKPETFVNPRLTLIHSSAKMLTDVYLKVFGARLGISINTGLIAMAYGPGNLSKMVTNVVINKLQNNVSPDLVSGDNLYDLIYISDITSAFLSIAEKGIPAKTYYIGHNNTDTFRDLFTRIGQIISPKTPLRFGVYPDENCLDYTEIDRHALTSDTGWVPSADFESSIISTSNFIKDSGIKFF